MLSRLVALSTNSWLLSGSRSSFSIAVFEEKAVLRFGFGSGSIEHHTTGSVSRPSHASAQLQLNSIGVSSSVMKLRDDDDDQQCQRCGRRPRYGAMHSAKKMELGRCICVAVAGEQ